MKIAFLTAGGIAPCLSASIGMLIKKYSKLDSSIEFIGYLHGYKGLLKGDKIILYNKNIAVLNEFGGSLLGNSRVKLSNIKDCIKNGYINDNENPLEISAQQLINDKVDILHTIGGDDTNITAGDLVEYLNNKKYKINVVGLPKTIDNDIYPIKQTLGAYTAAEQTSLFFKNIVNENTTSSRQLIIHEIMGRNCGWLTAYSAYLYQKSLKNKNFLPDNKLYKEKWNIHAIYIPEIEFNLSEESNRLNLIMDKYDCVNIFLCEGAGLSSIIKEMKNNKEDIKYDAFGNIRLDEINPGIWFANYFRKKINAHKVLIQKSGYFARSASPNNIDIELIDKSTSKAIECALNNESGIIGLHQKSNMIECIDFKIIKGDKRFNPNVEWFKNINNTINKLV